MIHSKYDVMKQRISEMNFPDYRYEQLIKMIFAQPQRIPDFNAMYLMARKSRQRSGVNLMSQIIANYFATRPAPSRRNNNIPQEFGTQGPNAAFQSYTRG